MRVFTPSCWAGRDGHIVNTASMAGLVVEPGNAVYNVTKHGVVTLSETLYQDWPLGSAVRVSVSVPGLRQHAHHGRGAQPAGRAGRQPCASPPGYGT